MPLRSVLFVVSVANDPSTLAEFQATTPLVFLRPYVLNNWIVEVSPVVALVSGLTRIVSPYTGW